MDPFSLNTASTTADQFSPRFWILWPGVLLMIAVSFTELALQYKVFIYINKAIWRASNAFAADVMKKLGRPQPKMEQRGAQDQGVCISTIGSLPITLRPLLIIESSSTGLSRGYRSR